MVQHVYSIARIRLGKESLSKTHTINNNDFLGSLVDSSLGSKVVSTGSLNSGLIDGDNGTVGVSHQAVAVSGTVAVRSNSSSGIESASKATSGSEVVSTSSSDSRLVSRDDSSVGVGHQVGVQVQGAGVAGVADSRNGSNRGSDGGSSDDGSGDGNGSNGGVLGSSGGKVVGTGSSNGGLINRDNGSIGVTNQVGVQVEGARVTVSSSVDGSSSDGRGSCVANTSISKSSTATTGSKVVGTGSSNCWLVHRDNGTVGVTNQTVLGGREGNTRGENQELHCCLQLCA